MDLKRARAISRMRTDYLEALEKGPEASGEIGELTPKQRFDALAARVSANVRHQSMGTGGTTESLPVPVDRHFGGPLPNLSMRFLYSWRKVEEDSPEALRGERNEHGEYISGITVHWMHTPDGDGTERYPTSNKSLWLPEPDPDLLAKRKFRQGEIFAGEHLWRPEPNTPIDADLSEKLTVIEQSLDVYEPALVKYLAENRVPSYVSALIPK